MFRDVRGEYSFFLDSTASLTRLVPLPTLDPRVRLALAGGLDGVPSAETRRMADHLATIFGRSLVAILHYGSRAQSSDPRPDSDHDFFVVVDRYADAYRALSAARGMHAAAGKASLLARVLPPNVLAIGVPGIERKKAKCVVLSLRDFMRACSPQAQDHFAQGRLFQHVLLLWTRDSESRALLIDTIVRARAGTFEWAKSSLPATFTADEYSRSLLETSFGAEIRPESGNRVAALFAAQRDTLVRMYEPLLDALVDAGTLARDASGTYGLAAPLRAAEIRRVARYFRKSKLRATVRWVKYVALYDDWLNYIVQKIARRTDRPVELTERERRYPLIFLWPKAVRFLMERPQRRR